jgi:hypothetical protein
MPVSPRGAQPGFTEQLAESVTEVGDVVVGESEGVSEQQSRLLPKRDGQQSPESPRVEQPGFIEQVSEGGNVGIFEGGNVVWVGAGVG